MTSGAVVTIVCDRAQRHPRKHPRVVVARYRQQPDGWERDKLGDRVDFWSGDGRDAPILPLAGSRPTSRAGRFLSVDPFRDEAAPEPVRFVHRLTCPHCYKEAQDSYRQETIHEALTLAAVAGVSLLTMADLSAIVQEMASRRDDS